MIAALLLACAWTGGEDSRSWSIAADAIHTATGSKLEGGRIVVTNGKISGILGGAGGSGTLNVFAVTPGMIDLSARVDLGWRSVEQSSETPVELRVIDSLDPFAEEWLRQARSGVTTVLANPPDDAVIGGLGVVLKTAGALDLRGRMVKSDAVLRAAIGSQPSQRNHPAFGRPTDFYSRRPTTRMGVEWALRKAFFDAAYAKRDSERDFPGARELQSVLDGSRPIVIQAWTTQDIRTAVFWKEEMQREGFGRPRLILDAAAEAWKEPDLLVRSQASVVLPPHPINGRTSDGAFMAWDTAKVLHDQGVVIALSSHNSASHEARLGRQAGFAMRGGLSFDAALAAVTINPARMVGIDDRVGTIEVGKDADLVLWNGTPFEPTSRVVGVLVDGLLILDPRDATTTSPSK